MGSRAVQYAVRYCKLQRKYILICQFLAMGTSILPTMLLQQKPETMQEITPT